MLGCFGASLAGGEDVCEVFVGNGVVWAGVEVVAGVEIADDCSCGDDVEGGEGEGGDDAGMSGGSGSSEAICCCTWSSSAGNDVGGSWACPWTSGRVPSRSFLLVDPAVGWLFRPSPVDLTNRSTNEGLAFKVGRRPNITLEGSNSQARRRSYNLLWLHWALRMLRSPSIFSSLVRRCV